MIEYNTELYMFKPWGRKTAIYSRRVNKDGGYIKSQYLLHLKINTVINML